MAQKLQQRQWGGGWAEGRPDVAAICEEHWTTRGSLIPQIWKTLKIILNDTKQEPSAASQENVLLTRATRGSLALRPVASLF